MANNAYSNDGIFGAGRLGLLQLMIGGDIQIPETASMWWREDGSFVIDGHDPLNTVTVYPFHNIAYVRTWNKRKEIRPAPPVPDTGDVEALYSDEELREIGPA